MPISVVIPMAGRGQRFAAAGYTLPKYMLAAGSYSLLEYSLRSLPLDIVKDVIFVGLREHEDKFGLTSFVEKTVANIFRRYNVTVDYEVLMLDTVTQGQAETVLQAEFLIPSYYELLIYNIDTYSQSPTLRNRLCDPTLSRDGVLGTFRVSAREGRWSYAEVDENGVVKQTAEKEPISSYALTGLYHFTNSNDFFSAAREWIQAGRRVRGEIYVAPLYNDLICKGKKFVLDVAEEFVPLGTPEELEQFRHENT